MSTETNKAASRSIYEEAFNKGNLAVLDKITAPGSVVHDPGNPNTRTGPEGSKQDVTMYRTAFPDLHFTIEDQVAEGDMVMTRWTGRGTQKGELPGLPPTGKQATVTGIEIDRFAGGKIVESWINKDDLGMLQQLGVIPAPGQAGH